ncbi:MAG TPA: sigma 54-interacting transcriptional regulator [Candidatus Angelobacter sp.]|nr:sigma 54-interacting transcriptional regulator [Candidatus Angelobacter sp.]
MSPHSSWTASGLVARSDALNRVLKLVEQVSRHPAAVLIVGETGTGKEMIARAIHTHSLRCNAPWIDVNCAAIPEHLVESELFGYEKGAFSGADAMKPGLFELADKGTLLLDEIGDLDPKVQVKLLRVLDGVPYYRLGGSKKVTVDVRVVAATNQDLEELVRAGRFRGDLYHRLAQFKLEIPPLRERPEDLLGIAEHLLHQHYPDSRFTSDAVKAMLSYRWPGNVRELKNAIFHAVMYAKNPETEISAADLRLPEAAPTNGHALNGDLNQVERQMIFQALEKFDGNQGKAAEALGISRRTLIRKLKAYRENDSENQEQALRAEQERYYRAQMSIPVRLKYAAEQLEATVLNLSIGGAAILVERSLSFGMPASISFVIPDTDQEVELSGKIAWSNSEDQHGIQFTDLSPDVRSNLLRWLTSQMKKEETTISS